MRCPFNGWFTYINAALTATNPSAQLVLTGSSELAVNAPINVATLAGTSNHLLGGDSGYLVTPELKYALPDFSRNSLGKAQCATAESHRRRG